MVDIINNISDRQNDIRLLRLQYCARHFYNSATMLNILTWIFCIIITVVLNLSVVKNALGNNKVIITGVLNLLGIAFDFFLFRFVQLGAAYKMWFDYLLFGFPRKDNYQGVTTNQLNRIMATITRRYKRRYIIEITHNGISKPHGVRDWYYDISDKIDKNKAIVKCQEQNGFFDKSIMIVSWWTFVSIVICAIVIVIVVKRDIMLRQTIYLAYTCLALFVKIIKEIYLYVKAYATYYLGDSLDIETHNESDDIIMVRQHNIDYRRRLNLITPNIIYRIKSLSLHSQVKAENSISNS